MKITVKTISGQTFDIDVQPTDTVLNIKEKIQEAKQFEIGLQKLLKKGTLLADASTVGELNFQDKDFLVVMVSKKPQQPQQIPPQVPVQQQQPIQQPVQQPVIQAPVPQLPPQQTNQLSSGQQFDEAIQNMISMGFDKPQCEAAMKAAFNNPDRAVEYLLNGIPQYNQAPHPNPIGSQPVQPGANTTLESISQLRQQFQQNPQAMLSVLPQLLEQLQQTDPQLSQQIQQNPEAFLQLLLQEPQNTGMIDVELSQQEEDDINQLVGMGFLREDVLEAYLSCDKNVETAAAYLFDKQQRGDLLTQHIEREENNPDNQDGDHGPDYGDEDDDDDVYQ